MKLSFLIVVVGSILLAASSSVGADAKKPVKVFILAGQSNMEGQAVVDLEGKDYNNGNGTLASLFRSPKTLPLVRHLKDEEGHWAVRDDVWVRYQRERGPLLKGPLGIGFSVYGGQHHFGPELQFGHVVGDGLDNQILLIKTAWGGKSLYKDFRPPSSGGEVGPYYTKMIAQVREALANLKSDFPAYDGSGYELAGFVWYHGWNDGVDPKTAVPQYEQNLVNLIQDVRKEFKTPKLPVVIGEITGPWIDAPPEWTALRNAQKAAASRPEFKGNVLFVETRNFVRKPEDSPNPSHGHHEFGNAETYFLVGDALGKGMKTLLGKPKRASGGPLPTSRTEHNIEGWKVLVDDRLTEPAHAELKHTALRWVDCKLSEIKVVVPPEIVADLQKITIVLDWNHGDLKAMQYHPSADWLKAHGYSAELARCVHLCRADDLATRRNISEMPWVLLHELAHAYHDQMLGFDDPRIIDAYKKYKESGHGDAVLLHNGNRVKHYALTNHKEFFAEMTETFFGCNDFYPFNGGEMKESEPEIHRLMTQIWGPTAKK